jgi:hypothetical protein
MSVERVPATMQSAAMKRSGTVGTAGDPAVRRMCGTIVDDFGR